MLDSSPMSASGTLGGFYRENGESAHLARLEAALPAGWLPTREVAIAAGVSPSGWTRRALEYLAEEGRAEKRLGVSPVGRRRRSRWEWRRPS